MEAGMCWTDPTAAQNLMMSVHALNPHQHELTNVTSHTRTQ